MIMTPLHTRMMTLRLSWASGGQVVAEARLIDMRKRGIVSLGSRLQGPGVVHDMGLTVRIDAAALRIVAIEPAMRAYPFLPTEASGGESCPDRLPGAQALVGLALSGSYQDVVMDEIGATSGCFHVYTLMRLLGPSVVWALEHAQEQSTSQAPGQPLFSRSILVDGHKGEGLSLGLQSILTDVHYAEDPQERLAAGFAAAVDISAVVPSLEITSASGRLRRSGPGTEARGPWTPLEDVANLCGVTLRKGYSAAVLARLCDAEESARLHQLLFMVAPVVMQCMPSLADELDLQTHRRDERRRTVINSCHMWREDGPLVTSLRKAE
jgi:hypothetical protein